MATRKPSNPDAVAIHAVAKAANLSSRELMNAIEQWDLGWDATNHMKRLSQEQVEEVARRLNADLSSILTAKPVEAAKPAKKAASKPKAAAGRAKAKVETEAAPPAKAEASPEAPTKGKPAAKSAPKADEDPAPAKAKRASKDDKPAPSKAKAKQPPAKPDAPEAAPRDGAKKAEKEPAQNADATQDDERSQDPTPEQIAEQAKEILGDILDGMGFPHPRITVHVAEDAVRVSLAGRGIAEILGQRNASARTDILEALQLVLQKSLFGNDHRNGPAVAIDVMGFREGREQELRAMAQRMAAYVEKTGNVLRVAAMNFIDRRAVHQSLSEHQAVRTESAGYGTLRSLEVSSAPRSRRANEERHDEPKDDRGNQDASQGQDRNESAQADDRRASDKKGPRKSSRRASDNSDHAASRAAKDASKQSGDPSPQRESKQDDAANEGNAKSEKPPRKKHDGKSSDAKRSGRKPRKPKDDAPATDHPKASSHDPDADQN